MFAVLGFLELTADSGQMISVDSLLPHPPIYMRQQIGLKEQENCIWEKVRRANIDKLRTILLNKWKRVHAHEYMICVGRRGAEYLHTQAAA